MTQGHVAKDVAQAGFSLFEAALALMVVGVLIGATLVPLGAKIRAERVSKAQDQLADINTAILGYATSHRTAGAMAIYNDPPHRRHAAIPSGRPYLPCPDVTGDGLEDRHAMPELADIVAGSAGFYVGPRLDLLTITRFSPLASTREMVAELEFLGDDTVWMEATGVGFVYATTEYTPIVVTLSEDRDNNQLVTMGSCYSDKGSLPWSTLGTHAHDPWGNRFTYRVDPIFANPILGIGPDTRSDMFDPRFPLVEVTLDLDADTPSRDVGYASYARRDNSYIATTVVINGSNTDMDIDELPGLVCTDADPGIGCSITDNPGNVTLAKRTLNDFAVGRTTLFDVMEGVTVARLYQRNELINGMAYVVVSHGANGWGAVPHLQSQNVNTGAGLACNEPTRIGTDWSVHHPETENIDYPRDSVCGASPVPSSNMSFPHNSSFVKMPEHLTGTSRFDDLVMHASGEQLKSSLRDLGIKLDHAWMPPGTCDAC